MEEVSVIELNMGAMGTALSYSQGRRVSFDESVSSSHVLLPPSRLGVDGPQPHWSVTCRLALRTAHGNGESYVGSTHSGWILASEIQV